MIFSFPIENFIKRAHYNFSSALFLFFFLGYWWWNSGCLSVCTWLCAHVEARGWHQVSSSVRYHYRLWNRISHWTWSAWMGHSCLSAHTSFLCWSCRYVPSRLAVLPILGIQVFVFAPEVLHWQSCSLTYNFSFTYLECHIVQLWEHY